MGTDIKCGRCRRQGVPNKRFRNADPAQRQQWRTQGVVRMEARGLCASCYRWAMTHDRLMDYELTNRPREEILEDWDFLADPLRPITEEVRRLAPRFGMTEQALLARLTRAGVRSRFEGGWGRRVKAA